MKFILILGFIVTCVTAVCEVPRNNELNTCNHINYLTYRNEDTTFSKLDDDARQTLISVSDEIIFNDIDSIKLACAFFFLRCNNETQQVFPVCKSTCVQLFGKNVNALCEYSSTFVYNDDNIDIDDKERRDTVCTSDAEMIVVNNIMVIITFIVVTLFVIT